MSSEELVGRIRRLPGEPKNNATFIEDDPDEKAILIRKVNADTPTRRYAHTFFPAHGNGF